MINCESQQVIARFFSRILQFTTSLLKKMKNKCLKQKVLNKNNFQFIVPHQLIFVFYYKIVSRIWALNTATLRKSTINDIYFFDLKSLLINIFDFWHLSSNILKFRSYEYLFCFYSHFRYALNLSRCSVARLHWQLLGNENAERHVLFAVSCSAY